jgi:hypothetical protein
MTYLEAVEGSRRPVTSEEIEQKMHALAREYPRLTTRKSQERFLNWLGG